MPSYENFNEYVASYIREKNPRMASRLLKDGKVPAQIAIEIMQSEGVPEDKIRRFEERAMRDGSLEMTYEGAQRIYDKLREVIEQKGGERNEREQKRKSQAQEDRTYPGRIRTFSFEQGENGARDQGQGNKIFPCFGQRPGRFF